MNEKRVILVTFILLLFLIFLLSRGFILTLFPPTLETLPVKNIPIFPQRGIIFDSNHIPLVMNAHKYFYYLDSGYFKQNRAEGKLDDGVFFKQVESIFGLKKDDILEKVETMPFVPLSSSETQVMEIPKPASMYISIDHRNERYVLYPELGQVLGKVDSFGSGVNALEDQFDDLLAPKGIGQIFYEKYGNYAKMGEILSVTPPTDGTHLFLTIDVNLQKIIATRVQEGVQKYSAKSGLGILIETKTGKVRAMYSTTGLNDAAISVFEPGSALKPFIFASAMKYHLLLDEELYNCVGKIKPYKDLPTIINDTHVHGQITTADALAKSCNVATVEIALRFLEEMGNWTWYKELLLAGFGKKTGIEFPGEVSGILHPPNSWNRLTGMQMTIGQGIAVTALQLVSAFNIFANAGVYVAPTLLNQRINPLIQRRVYPTEVVERISKMLERTVISGTGTAARTTLVNIAGKTGTAQKAFPGLGYVKGKYFSSFIGYFPAENPAYTLLISFDEPQGDIYYGGDVSAPIFRNIVEDYLRLLESSLDREIKPLLFKSWKLPDFKGLTRKDVVDIVTKLEIPLSSIRFQGEGVVVSQIPEESTPLSEVESIVFFLEKEGG